MGIYVNNKLIYVVDKPTLNTTITLTPGTYKTTVEEWDHCKGATVAHIDITVGTGTTTPTGVSVTSPVNGSTVTSPVSYVATATTSCSKGVASMGIYVNNQKLYVVAGNSMNTQLAIPAGTQHTTVEEWDRCGGAATAHIVLTVSATAATPTVSIAASPASISSGSSSTLTFTATNATQLAITGTDGSKYTVSPSGGTQKVNPTATTSYTAIATGAHGTASASTTVTVTAKTLASIAVTPSTPSLAVGATQQFTAMATYSDNSTANVTSTATWAAAKTAVATISSTGLATAVASGSTQISATVNGITGNATLSVTSKTLASIAVTPSTPSVAVGATQQFTATASYSDNSTADVTSTATWAAAKTAVATISSTGLATAVASGSTQISATVNGVSGNAALTVTSQSSGGNANILTRQFDNNRSGLNPGEQSLTPSNVTPATFGKLFSYLVDGYIYAEPLLVSGLTVNGSTHDVVFVATQRDSVYAFDADNYGSGTPLWQVSLLQSGETPVTTGEIQPYNGVTSTPVIDLGSNTMYVVSVQVQSGNKPTFRLNALDITTGAQKFDGPMTIQASVPGTSSVAVNGMLTLPSSCIQRAALLLANNTIYIGFGSCHSGWLLAYNAQTLAQTGVFNASPNLNGEGTYASAGGVWMGSGGPVADSSGNVYVTTGNGPWDGKTAWSDSILKFNSTAADAGLLHPQQLPIHGLQ